MPVYVRTINFFLQLLFALGVQQRHLRTFNHRHIRAAGDFRGPKSEDCRRLHPLIAANRGNAQQIDLLGAQKHQERKEIRALRSGAVLIGDDFNFFLLRKRGWSKQQATKSNKKEGALHHEQNSPSHHAT